MSRVATVRVSTWREQVRTSLFFVPLVLVGAGVVLAEAALYLDQRLVDSGVDPPFTLSYTVEGARAILTTIATATVTVAGIAFSVSLLVLQLASTQYSPRIMDRLFRDPFNKRVIGLVAGTFAYCLLVLRAIRGPLDSGGEAVVPAVSVALATVLGLVSLLGIVAFINHSAHTMDVSELLQRITEAGLAQLRGSDGLGTTAGVGRAPESGQVACGAVDTASVEQCFRVCADVPGWLQQVDAARVLAAVVAGSTVRLETTPGRYLIPGSPLCTVWPVPPPEDRDRLTASVRRAFQVGPRRTMHQDVAFGLRQLADVALKALSPAVNDPTTAQDAVFHAAALLQEALIRPEPAARTDDRGSTVIPAEDRDHEALIRVAFDEVRRDAAAHPAMCTYLLEAIHSIYVTLPADESTHAARRSLQDQARLVLKGCERSGALEEDVAAVRAQYVRRFGAPHGVPRETADGTSVTV